MTSSSGMKTDQYTVVVPNQNGTLPATVLRAASHPNTLICNLNTKDNIKTAYDIFQRGLRISRHQPCLGKRQKGKAEGYVWWTYSEVETMAHMLGSGIIHNNLIKPTTYPDEEYSFAKTLNMIGIMAKNRLEWFITEQAANCYNFTLVPLYSTLGEDAMRYILSKTRLTCLAASEADLSTVLNMIMAAGDERFDNISAVVAFDPTTPTTQQLAKKLGIQIYYWVDVMDRAKKSGTLKPAPGTPEQVQTICYTSGTTGVPKGVIITHRMFAALMNAAAVGPLGPSEKLTITKADMHLSYLPCAHVFERAIDNIMWYYGGKIAIYGGEPKELLEDLKAAAPTIFISVPRLFMRIDDKIRESVRNSSRFAQYAFRTALESKLDNLEESGTEQHWLWDRTVLSRARKLMGGRLRYLLTGGAALAPEIQSRLAVLFGAGFLQGYGATETLGAACLARPHDRLYGHIGAPVPALEAALEPWENDEREASPNAERGQLLLRGATVMPGYFLDSAATRAALTPDKWYRTGDIAARFPPDGRLVIIDRASSLFKLPNGEFVSPEKLEGIYQGAPLVGQLYVHGQSPHPYLVAIVCLDPEAAEAWETNRKKGSPKKKPNVGEEVVDPILLAEVRAQLNAQAEGAKLAGFEKLKGIYVWSEQFSPENGMLTPTLKLKRGTVAKRFSCELERLLRQPN